MENLYIKYPKSQDSFYNIYGGVYCFLNKQNNKKYIGGTTNLYKRLNQHIKGLRYNRHENEYLQNAFNKYGEDNFEILILEKHLNLKDEDFKNFLLLREQLYLDKLIRKGFDYNMRPCAWDATGSSMSSKAKKRISELRMINHHNAKSCYRYNDKGDLLEEYKSVAECCRINKYTSSKLQTACRNNSYYKNCFWSYNKNHNFDSLIINERKINTINPNSVPIILLNTGEKFKSIKEFCNQYNVTKGKALWALKRDISLKNGLTIKFYGESQ